MKLQLTTLLTGVFVSISTPALAASVPGEFTCRDSLVASIVDGKERVESTRVCVNEFSRPSGSNLIQALASENCAKGKCAALRKAMEQQGLPRPAREKYQSIAPKRFDFCLRLGGEPASLKFQWNSIWHVSDRCLFTEDYSYIDTMSLYSFNESPLKQRLELEKTSSRDSDVPDQTR